MEDNAYSNGETMFELATQLYPICRSISGEGIRQTHAIIKKHLPELATFEVPSGTRVCDWVVPDEWNIRGGYIESLSGKRIIDFTNSNLHIMGYSEPIDQIIDRDELEKHLYTRPDMPNAIPYVTSYYKRQWGFCCSEEQKEQLTESKYKVKIDSTLAPGSLTYSELLIPGESTDEVMISTYTCHPSMANNELSGPVLATALGKQLQDKKNRYTYRIIFASETIGPLMYMERHLQHLKKHVKAAFNLTCVGDNRAVSFMPTPSGDTLTDRVSRHVLKHKAPEFDEYSFWQNRGSDERQYCSPNAKLPMVSIMRSRYATYPEYHTSLDDLSIISPAGLQKSFDLHMACIDLLEANGQWQSTIIGEPHLMRRNLIDQLGGAVELNQQRTLIQTIMTASDGTRDLLNIADLAGVYAGDLTEIVQQLIQRELLK